MKANSLIPKQVAEKAEARVKRPKSAYLHFITENRERIKEQNPGISNADLVKRAAEVWNQCTPEQKAPYEQLHKNDQDRYQKELQENNSGKRRKKSATQKQKEAAAASANGAAPAVKKELTPYFKFKSEVMPALRQQHPNVKMADMMKMVGEMWRNLPEEKRNQYKLEYAQHQQQTNGSANQKTITQAFQPHETAASMMAADSTVENGAGEDVTMAEGYWIY